MKRLSLLLSLTLILFLSACHGNKANTMLSELFGSDLAYVYEEDNRTIQVLQKNDGTYFKVSESDKTYEAVMNDTAFYSKHHLGGWYVIDKNHALFNRFNEQIITINDDITFYSEFKASNDTTYTALNANKTANKIFKFNRNLTINQLVIELENNQLKEIRLSVLVSGQSEEIDYVFEFEAPRNLPNLSVTQEPYISFDDFELYPEGVTLLTSGYMQAQDSFGTLIYGLNSRFVIETKPNFEAGQALELAINTENKTRPLGYKINSNYYADTSVQINGDLANIGASFANLLDAQVISVSNQKMVVSKDNFTYEIFYSETLDSNTKTSLLLLQASMYVNINSMILANQTLYYSNASSLEIINDTNPVSLIKPTEDIMLLKDAARLNDVTTGFPATGTPNLLVIPVAFTDYPAAYNLVDRLETALFGTESETGYESLSSYYYQSSYEKLLIGGTVLEPYQTGKPASYYENAYQNGNEYVDYDIMQAAIRYYDNQVDYAQYDTDEDGKIDGIILVYTAPVSFDSGSDLWWAYTYQYYTQATELYDGVEMDFYMFLGSDFLDEVFNPNYDTYIDHNAVTFIHEMGHMLGLEDYYDYEIEIGPTGGIGGGDMMDFAVGDHNAFSKLLLGWITPMVTTGMTDTFSLKPFESSGEAIIIPKSWQNNYFSEYLIIDYYTPTGLNEPVAGVSGLFSESGIRIYHVYANMQSHNLVDSIFSVYKYNNSNTDKKLIRLIEADGNNDIEDTTYYASGGYGENSDLFQLNDQLSNFKWYDGSSADFTLVVNQLTLTQATFTITFS